MMKKIWSVFLTYIIGFSVSNTNVLAYIDPGTGAMVIGSIWPAIVAFFAAVGAFFVKIFWKPIKKNLLRLSGKERQK